MKKLFYLLLLIAMPLAFVACGDKDEDEIDNPDGKEEPQEEKFVWGGDWNNPTHEKYATYKGKYNPIEGDWLEIIEPRNRYIFGSNLEYKILYLNDRGIWVTNISAPYGINDISLQYNNSTSGDLHTKQYKIIKEGGKDVLYIRLVRPGLVPNYKWERFTRY